MITVCSACEGGLSGQQATMCDECGSEYHIRCWNSRGECKTCAERREEEAPEHG
jgi:hypothetical protein